MIYENAFVEWLNNWQTLITGGLALGAAYYAGRPVYRQLALMRAQNNVMVRESIGHMIVQLDAQRDRLSEITAARLSEVRLAIDRFDHYGKPGGIDEWANDQLHKFQSMKSELRAFFVQSHDVEGIEDCKSDLLSALDEFYSVLWDIQILHHASWEPEEFNWSDEERAEVIARSNEAENELNAAAGAVYCGVGNLYAAYAARRDALVRRLRVIDDSLLA